MEVICDNFPDLHRFLRTVAMSIGNARRSLANSENTILHCREIFHYPFHFLYLFFSVDEQHPTRESVSPDFVGISFRLNFILI